MNAPAKDAREKPTDKSKSAERSAPERPAPEAAKASAQSGAAVDVAALPTEALEELKLAVDAELESRRSKQRDGFIASIREQAQKLGLDAVTVAALLVPRAGSKKRSGSDRRSAVAAKYRNPSNPAETWAGRGAQPMWVREQLAAGKKLEDFQIP